MPTIAPPALVEQYNAKNFSPFAMESRESDKGALTLQQWLDREVRSSSRSLAQYRYAYEKTGILCDGRHAFRVHHSWQDTPPLLWGEEPKQADGIANCLLEWESTAGEWVEVFPQHRWVTDNEPIAGRKTFRFPPLGEDRTVATSTTHYLSRYIIDEKQSLCGKYVHQIVRFGHERNAKINVAESVEFWQQVVDGKSFGRVVQVWTCVQNCRRCIGFLMPLVNGG